MQGQFYEYGVCLVYVDDAVKGPILGGNRRARAGWKRKKKDHDPQ